jgi:hypothetical protein
MDTALAVLEQHAEAIRLKPEPFVALNLYAIRANPAGQEDVYPLLCKRRHGSYAAATT